MPVTTRSQGWGFIGALLQVSANNAGVQSTVANVGVGLQVVAGANPLRLASLGVKITPKISAGDGDSPTQYRVLVLRGALPADISSLQGTDAASPSPVPHTTASQSAVEILYDNVYDSSLDTLPPSQFNVMHEIVFPDGGPQVGAYETLSALLVPMAMIDPAPTALGAGFALLSLFAYGVNVPVAQTDQLSVEALPRWPNGAGQ